MHCRRHHTASVEKKNKNYIEIQRNSPLLLGHYLHKSGGSYVPWDEEEVKTVSYLLRIPDKLPMKSKILENWKHELPTKLRYLRT